jgi:tRNA (cmo5U34)-methyltransferase
MICNFEMPNVSKEVSMASGESSPAEEQGWSESNSELFIDAGRLFTPNRHEIARTIVDLVPAAPDESFLAVEIGTGQGWLSEALLQAFPAAYIVGLDGSPTMLRAAGELLAPFADRVALRQFRLEDWGWLDQLEAAPRFFTSSLVIHHLDGDQKRAFFRALYERLAAGGALIIADVVAATSEPGRRAWARAWDADVRRQSIELAGDLRGFEFFTRERWNMYAYPEDDPDPIDKPSALPDQLRWLEQAGFAGVDVFWARAGHAIFGGYKPS